MSGLQPGSLYQFRVKALNKIGSSAFSEVKAFATNEEGTWVALVVAELRLVSVFVFFVKLCAQASGHDCF